MDKIKNSKEFIEYLTKGGISAALLFIVCYFGNIFLQNLQNMQKDLSAIRIQITKVQANILTPQQVEKMIDNKIKILEYHYHNKK